MEGKAISPDRGGLSTIWRVLIVATLVLAIGALGVGIAAVARKNGVTPASSTAPLTKRLDSEDQQIQALTSQLNKARDRADRLGACLPELQTEVTGLGIDTSGSTPSITNNQQVSAPCQKIFYQSNAGG